MLSLDQIQWPCQPKVDAKHPGVAVALDELQDEKSYGGHRSSLERPCRNVSWKKKIRRVFRKKNPVIYRLSSKKHFKIPGKIEPILEHESVFSLLRKRHFFKKRSKRWRGFPPAGSFCLASCSQPYSCVTALLLLGVSSTSVSCLLPLASSSFSSSSFYFSSSFFSSSCFLASCSCSMLASSLSYFLFPTLLARSLVLSSLKRSPGCQQGSASRYCRTPRPTTRASAWTM